MDRALGVAGHGEGGRLDVNRAGPGAETRRRRRGPRVAGGRHTEGETGDHCDACRRPYETAPTTARAARGHDLLDGDGHGGAVQRILQCVQY
jgi:hypothetical protein